MSTVYLDALLGVTGTLLRGLTALIRDTIVMWGLHWKRVSDANMRVFFGSTKALLVKHVKPEGCSEKPSTRSNIQPAVIAVGQDQ